MKSGSSNSLSSIVTTINLRRTVYRRVNKGINIEGPEISLKIIAFHGIRKRVIKLGDMI